jgi:hypothetical protein
MNDRVWLLLLLDWCWLRTKQYNVLAIRGLDLSTRIQLLPRVLQAAYLMYVGDRTRGMLAFDSLEGFRSQKQSGCYRGT